MSEIPQNPSFPFKVTKQVKNNSTNKRGKSKSANYKQQPLKVVYISNPMKIQASAAEFRALVQKHTGRDASDWPEDRPKLQVPDGLDDEAAHKELGLAQPMGCFGSDPKRLGSDPKRLGPSDGDGDYDNQMVVGDDFFSFFMDDM